jgi:hypothetical protein
MIIGGFWTWSKVMDFGQAAPGPGGGGNPDFLPDSLFYGRSSGDHTQYNSVDTMAMFIPTGQQINNTLGQYNNASAARNMVLALKLKF